MQINWLYVGLLAFIVYVGIFTYFVLKRRWTWVGLGIGLGNLLVVLLNLVAPFRGVLDPDYLGFNLGLIHVAPGILVTVVSGSIVIGCLASACFAVLNLRGRTMVIVAFIDLVLLILVGLPVLVDGLANPAESKIQLGEYLVIPGMVSVIISGLLFTLPLLAGVVWSAKRMRNSAAE